MRFKGVTLKYDILFQLIKIVDFENFNFSNIEVLVNYTANNLPHFIKHLIQLAPAIGESVLEDDSQKSLSLVLGLSKLFDKLKVQTYRKYKKEINTDQDLLRASYFVEQFCDVNEGIYERNLTTQLIVQLINSLTTQADDKKVILIIDDLDRIDPDHIFRLLNVFASHIDVNQDNESENKFGFDQVMFVCDIENIKSIYHHKYGKSTDFNGYIDKFYSIELFKFNIRDAIISNVKRIIEKVNSINPKVLLSQNEGDDLSMIEVHLISIISTLICAGELNLRKLIKIASIDYSPVEYNIIKNITNHQVYIPQVFDFMCFIYGNEYDKLIHSLKKCIGISDFITFEEINPTCFYPILDIEEENFVTTKRILKSFKYNKNQVDFYYKINCDNTTSCMWKYYIIGLL